MKIKAQMIFFYFGSPISALNHFTLNLRFKISPDDKTLKRRKLRFCQKFRSQISLSVTVESKLGYLSDITSWWLCIVLSLSTSKVWIIRLDWNSDSKSISIFSFCWMLEISPYISIVNIKAFDSKAHLHNSFTVNFTE